MKRFEGTDALTGAKNEALSRMSGCSDENCSACVSNNKAIEKLVKVAQAAIFAPHDVKSLQGAINRLEAEPEPFNLGNEVELRSLADRIEAAQKDA